MFLLIRDHDVQLNSRIIAASIVSIVAYLVVNIFNPIRPLDYSEEMIEAARLMERAVTATGDYRDVSGTGIDEAVDPNRTGLIGPAMSGLMTTVGHLEAKRTTTNPDISSLVVHLLRYAGAAGGDTIAVGCSASFPALMIAALAAAEAMGIHPVVIISLGASSYGATDPDFNLLDMYRLLLGRGILNNPPAAVSLGGDRDIGEDFEEELKEQLIRRIESLGTPLIYEPDLKENVALRMGIYGAGAGGSRIAAFVNIGGGYANLGVSQLTLELTPGLNTRISIPPEEERGVLFEMAAHGVPAIHLLYIRGLASTYGLPWDPIPLPGSGETALVEPHSRKGILFWSTAGFYFAVMFLLIAFRDVKMPGGG